MKKLPRLTLVATGFLMAWGALYAAEPVGKVLLLVGSGTIQRGAQQLAMNRGTVVENGDLVRIDEGSQAQIRFSDDSMIALRSNSELKIEEFRYTEKGEGDKSVFSLLKGGLRTITGAIGKRNPAAYEMKGGAATIGIRGTHYTIVNCDSSCRNPDGSVVPKGLYGGVSEGRIVVSNQADAKEFSKEQYFTVATSDTTIKPLMAPPAFLREKPEALAKAASKTTTTQAATTDTQKKNTTSSGAATTSSSTSGTTTETDTTETSQEAAPASSSTAASSSSSNSSQTASSQTSSGTSSGATSGSTSSATGNSTISENSTTTVTNSVTPVASSTATQTVSSAAINATTPATTESSSTSGSGSSASTSSGTSTTGNTGSTTTASTGGSGSSGSGSSASTSSGASGTSTTSNSGSTTTASTGGSGSSGSGSSASTSSGTSGTSTTGNTGSTTASTGGSGSSGSGSGASTSSGTGGTSTTSNTGSVTTASTGGSGSSGSGSSASTSSGTGGTSTTSNASSVTTPSTGTGSSSSSTPSAASGATTASSAAYTTLWARLNLWWADLNLWRYYDAMNYAYAGTYSSNNTGNGESSAGISATSLRLDNNSLRNYRDAENAVVIGKTSIRNYFLQSAQAETSYVDTQDRKVIQKTDKSASTNIGRSESAGSVVWGRFSETVSTTYEDNSVSTVKSYRHWAVGDLLSYQPTSGLYIYTYSGGTSPTNQKGAVGTVTQGGTWLLNFDAMSLQTVQDLRWKMPDSTTFSLSVPYQVYKVSTNGVETSVTTQSGGAFVSRTICSGNGCVDAQSDLGLTLFGYRAKGLGAAVSTVANYADGSTQTTQSVQVYEKDTSNFNDLLKYGYAEAKAVKSGGASTSSVSAGNVAVAAENVSGNPDLLNTMIQDKSSLQKYLKDDFTTTTALVEEGKVVNRSYVKTSSKDEGSKSSAGNVAWGRFGETVTTKQEDGTSTVVNTYRHWAIGDPLSSLPTSGKFNYEYVGGTNPTDSSGTAGSLKQEGKWQLDFANKTVATTESLQWKMNNTGSTYSLSVPKQSYVLNASALTGTGGSALSSNTTCSGGGCVSAASNVAATLYGSGAKGLGVAISTTGTFANKSTQTMNSVQVYKKND